AASASHAGQTPGPGLHFFSAGNSACRVGSRFSKSTPDAFGQFGHGSLSSPPLPGPQTAGGRAQQDEGGRLRNPNEGELRDQTKRISDITRCRVDAAVERPDPGN